MTISASAYQKLLNLEDATFTLIDHEDAMVATVYKITKPNGEQFILKISERPNDYFREVLFKHFFDQRGFKDPYAWTLDERDHFHWLLSDGGKVIGYAHVQIWPEHRAALRIIVIDEQRSDREWANA